MNAVDRYLSDPSSPYSMTDQELDELVAAGYGEHEPVIDAIMVRDGQSVAARAEAIGVEPEDFAHQET